MYPRAVDAAPRSWGDRLAAARRAGFVGREAEIELFVQAIALSPPPFAVLFVHGPGGIGKTTLLERYAHEAHAREIPTTWLDARTVRPDASSFLAALGASSIEQLASRLAPRHVIFLDTLEEIRAIDPWIRTTLVPALPEGALLVLAGRDAPSPSWREDAGLAALVRVRALRNLRVEESDALLAARGVAAAHRARAHALTHGHPLALALVAEGARIDGSVPMLAPDVVRALLERIVRDLPSADRRAALEIAALLRVTNEAALADLGVSDPADALAWLRSLSFVHQTDEGVAPHDLVRDAVLAELDQRDPARRAELVARCRARNRRALASSSPRVRERAFFDVVFAFRDDPTMRAYYQWDGERGGGGSARPLSSDELTPLLDRLAHHEGSRSRELAARWWQEQPEAFHTLLDGRGANLGAIVYLHLSQLDGASADPAIASALAATAAAPSRPGERVAILRFWMWNDGYQMPGSAAHASHSMLVAFDWMFDASLSWVVLVVQNIDAWRPFFARIGFDERPEHAFTIDDRCFAILTRDLRARPWVSAAPLEGGGVPVARVVLSQEDFARAVRDALRVMTRPAELASSPLLSSRLVFDWAEDESPTPTMLRELLEAAVTALDDPEDPRPRRCLEATFVRPAPTHEAAAEALGLSFSTYRRQLQRGVDGVVAYLWAREVSGAR